MNHKALTSEEWKVSVSSHRVALSYLCILVGYSFFGIYALSLRLKFDFPVEIYWLSFVFVSIPLLCEVAFWRSGTKVRLFYLLSFSLMINLQYAVVDNSPLLLSGDAIADYRLTDKIISNSQWVPFEPSEWGLGSEYRFYPITNFVYATISLLTGIPLLMVVKSLFVVKALVVPPIVDRWFSSFFHQRVAYLGTVLFLASPGAVLFPHKESFAVIFFFLCMYASTKTTKNRQYLLIGLVSIVTLIMTHHFTTYIFLVLLTALFLASYFFKRQKVVRLSIQFFMLSWVIFLAWVVFIAWTVIAMHQRLVYEVFFEALLPGQLTFSELMPLYAPYERIVLLLGLGITVFSSGLGFLSFARNRKSFSQSFFAMTLFLIPVLAIASIFRFYPSGLSVHISHRAFEFGYIGVGALSGLFFVRTFQSVKKLTLKVILIGAITGMIIVGPMAGAMHPRTFTRLSNVVSFRVLSLNAWMSESNASNEYTVVDKLMSLVLSGYGDSRVVMYPELFASQDFSLPWDIRKYRSISYISTYEYMKDYYGPNVAKFNTWPFFHNIYTNGVLDIYGISNRTSS